MVRAFRGLQPYVGEGTNYRLDLGYAGPAFLKLQDVGAREALGIDRAGKKLVDGEPWRASSSDAGRVALRAIEALSQRDRLYLPCEFTVFRFDDEWVFSYFPLLRADGRRYPDQGVNVYVAEDLNTVEFSDDP